MNSDSNSQVLKVAPSRNLLVLRLALFCLFICALVFIAFSIGWNSLPLLHQVVLLAAPLFVCWNVFQMIRAIRTRPVWMQLGPDGVALSGEQMVSWERLKPIRWSFLKNALLFQRAALMCTLSQI